MYSMLVTLEVSKLSGWLNTDAPASMKSMLVTLEVSMLSGWLNADAPCRESKGRYAVRGEVYGSAGGGQRRPRCKQRVGQGSTAHMGHGKGTVNMKLVVVKGVRRTQRAGGGSDGGG